jgi:hypothetical protein
MKSRSVLLLSSGNHLTRIKIYFITINVNKLLQLEIKMSDTQNSNLTPEQLQNKADAELFGICWDTFKNLSKADMQKTKRRILDSETLIQLDIPD